MPGAPHTRKDFEHLIGTDYDDMHVNDVQQIMMNNGAYRWQIQCTCNVCGMERNFLSLNFKNHAGTTHKYCHHNDKEKYNYLRGQKFDDVIVENVYGKYFGKQGPYWMASCKCTVCGNVRDIFISDLLKEDNHSGRHQRCLVNKYHRHFLQTFYNMTRRCNDTTDKLYPDYGGRGIKCHWKTIEEFADDMYKSYLKKSKELGHNDMSIERIDVNGDYCKENCTWINRAYQRYNKTTTIYFKAVSPTGEVFYGSRLKMFCFKHSLSENVMQSALDTITHKATNGWYIVRISKSCYENYLLSKYNVPADIDYLIDALKDIFDRWIKDGIHTSTDNSEVICPRMHFESTVMQHISDDVADAICSIENKYNLSIRYDNRANTFRMCKLSE